MIMQSLNVRCCQCSLRINDPAGIIRIAAWLLVMDCSWHQPELWCAWCLRNISSYLEVLHFHLTLDIPERCLTSLLLEKGLTSSMSLHVSWKWQPLILPLLEKVTTSTKGAEICLKCPAEIDALVNWNRVQCRMLATCTLLSIASVINCAGEQTEAEGIVLLLADNHPYCTWAHPLLLSFQVWSG